MFTVDEECVTGGLFVDECGGTGPFSIVADLVSDSGEVGEK